MTIDLNKIAARIAAHLTASLIPLTELKQTVKSMYEDVSDPDMKDLLSEIIEFCDENNPKAYLLMEDLKEMSEKHII